MNNTSKKKGGIVINGRSYDPEEIGLERLVYQGKVYVDVTPLFCDCGKSTKMVNEKISEIRARG